MVIGIARPIQQPDARDRFHRRDQRLNGGGILTLAEIRDAFDYFPISDLIDWK